MVHSSKLLIILISLLMGTCSGGNASSNQSSSENKVILNNQEINLSETDFQELHNVVADLLIKCDDFYEQIVSNDLVNEIKESESFIEIFYTSKIEVNIGNKQTIAIKQLFIPLTGKYQSNNEITFFCGNPGYSTQPFLNSKGFEKFQKEINKLTSK